MADRFERSSEGKALGLEVVVVVLEEVSSLRRQHGGAGEGFDERREEWGNGGELVWLGLRGLVWHMLFVLLLLCRRRCR